MFALGAVLWELVAGRRLFRGDNDAVTLANVLMLEPPSLARLRAKLPRGLDDAIRWALAKAPDARPASVEVLAEAIERASAGHVGPVREVRQVVLDLFGDDLAKRRANVLACASEDEPPPTAPTPGSATLVGPDATVRSPDTPEGAVAPLDRRITLRLESAPAPAASRAPATVPLPTVPLLVAPAPPRAVEAVTASIGVRRGRAVSWLVVALVGATLGTAAFGAAVLRHRRASVSVVSAPPESSPPRAPSAVSVEEPSEAPPSVSAAASAAAPASPSASVASPSPLVSSAPPPRLAAPPSASSARPTRRTPAPPAATHLVAPPNPYGAATGGT